MKISPIFNTLILKNNHIQYKVDRKIAFGSNNNLLLPENKSDCFENEQSQNHLEKIYGLYQKKLEESPRMAFLYNPKLSKSKKMQIIKKRDYIYNLDELSKLLNVPNSVLLLWLRAQSFKTERFNNDSYMDITEPKNDEFIKSIREKVHSSVSSTYMRNTYGMNSQKMEEMIKKKRLVLLGFEDRELPDEELRPSSYLIDLKNEKNVSELRLYPKKLIEYFRPSRSNKTYIVPAEILCEQGFGDINSLISLIREKKIEGIVRNSSNSEEKDVLVIIKNSKNVAHLMNLRNQNPNICTIPSLAAKLGVSKYQIRDAICRGDIDAIDSYIFESDAFFTHIDITKPKNAKYISQFLFEN